jgi:Holliday junction resolvase RusA-like endonuclease
MLHPRVRQVVNAASSDNLLTEHYYDLAACTKKRHNLNSQTPLSTRRYEQIITEVSRDQYQGQPMTERLVLAVAFGVPNLRGDVDNLIKSLQDGMQGIVYWNDSQIDALLAVRYKTETPNVDVRLFEWRE